jgi:hypothetical protein
MKESIEEVNYELIKAHILTPDQSQLTERQQKQLERIVSAAKLLDKNPVQIQCARQLVLKYPEIGQYQALSDIKYAMRLFNTFYTFDYDFWQTWLMNDIVKNIDWCRKQATPAAAQVIAREHANLIAAIGKKPEVLDDPRRMEKNNFYVVVQTANNNTVNIDGETLAKLPAATVAEINRALFSGVEITDVQAEEIMGT